MRAEDVVQVLLANVAPTRVWRCATNAQSWRWQPQVLTAIALLPRLAYIEFRVSWAVGF
jgi:hypothetical protein